MIAILLTGMNPQSGIIFSIVWTIGTPRMSLNQQPPNV